MGLQGAGYVALRAVGASLGLAVAGFAAGFVSSTATMATMGRPLSTKPSRPATSAISPEKYSLPR